MDSVVADLASTKVNVRGGAVTQLNMLPVAAISPAARSALVSLLEREATTKWAESNEAEAEAYHEYIIELVGAVIRLDDARGLRGVALLGIQTSRDAQWFVVRQGPAALAALAEAWTKPNTKPEVIETWGLLMASAPPWLSPERRYQLLERIAGAAPEMPIAVASVAQDDSILALMPFLVPAPEDADDPIVLRRIDKARGSLRLRMRGLTPTALVSELAVGTRLFCAGASGDRVRACTSVRNLLAVAAAHISARGTNAAHNTLNAVVARAEQAGKSGAFSRTEVAFIREVAASANSRL